jgi:hypothetical protein
VSKPIRTRIQDHGIDIMVQVTDETLELYRLGERQRRTISIDDVWRMARGTDALPPPITTRSKNSIVAIFVRHRGNASIWQRQDNGEELTERELRAAGRREGRPVIPLYGVPNQSVKGAGR